MAFTRRAAISGIITASIAAGTPVARQDDQGPPLPPPDALDEPKLPNGRLQRDAIAKEEHQEAIKEVNQLILEAQHLKDELEKSGNYVISMESVRKVEDIEKLARRIHGRLKT